MAVFKCKMCGGTLEIQPGASVCECEYCGTKQTLPKLDDDKKANLYDRANHFRRSNEFDKAMSIYEQILNEDNTDAEAYWSLVLCRYGIEYVEDPSSHKRIPTINRAQFTSIFDDENYKEALRHADVIQREIYEEEAKTINEIQKGILAISQKEEPFDIFICYKESDKDGRRTQDSVLANDLYHQLIQEGFKVFFSRITLEDKLGSAYEPYIFAALNSAKVMVVLGTKPEYFNAVWVKNEWSRYLSLIKQGQNKMLIPAYRDMDPYDLPEEFSHLQAQDMSKLGFMQDLIRGIKKILDFEKTKPATKETNNSNSSNNCDPLLKRAFFFLEDEQWEDADSYFEKVLDIDPENAKAYLGKMMVELQVRKQDDLSTYFKTIDSNAYYQKALRFGNDEFKKVLQNYNTSIIEHIKYNDQNAIYELALAKSGQVPDKLLKNIISSFEQIIDFKDSKEQIQNCYEKIYQSALKNYETLLDEQLLRETAKDFEYLGDYKNSVELANRCLEKAEDIRKEKIYNEALRKISSTPTRYTSCCEALELFNSIIDYNDSKDRIEECNRKINEIIEQGKKAAKKRKKIGIITCLIITALIASGLVFYYVIFPKLKYDKALKSFNEGNYENAIILLTELEDYKDSQEFINEVKYAQANEYLKTKKYDDAHTIFTEIALYKDSKELAKETIYQKAIDLYSEKKYDDAIWILTDFHYSDSVNLRNEIYYNKGLECLNKMDYKAAYESFSNVLDYNDGLEKMSEAGYKYSQKLIDSKDYANAITVLVRIKPINKDSSVTDLLDTCYMELSKIKSNDGNYLAALEYYKKTTGYSEKSDYYKDVVYKFVKANLSKMSTSEATLYTYFKKLKDMNYKDSAQLFKEKYSWKINGFIVNNSFDDDTTNKTTISKYDPVIFHFKLKGGVPDERIGVNFKITYPAGNTITSSLNDGVQGYPSSDYYKDFGWTNGIYQNPANGRTGTLKIQVYDHNWNYIGSMSVNIGA